MEWKDVKDVGCAPRWFVLPASYSEALSYGDQLGRICYALAQLVENNNNLPEYLQNLIEQYIQGDEIGEIVNQIISNYILNPKYPPNDLTPAVGDGSADDTVAVQGCIDYVHSLGGGAIYFPYGAYLVQPLTMYDNVSFIGFGRYNSKIVLKGGAQKALINGNCNNVSFSGLTLDGNSSVQVNDDINVVELTGHNYGFTDCYIKDGFELLNITGNNGIMTVAGCHFGQAVTHALDISGSLEVNLGSSTFQGLSAVYGVSLIKTAANNGIYNFTCNGVIPITCEVSGNYNRFDFVAPSSKQGYSDTGEYNSYNIVGKIVWNKLDDTFRTDADQINLQTRTGQIVATEDLLLEGHDFTQQAKGDMDINVTSAYDLSANDIVVKSGSTYSETVTGAATKSAASLTENVTGAVNRTAGAVTENVASKTITATGNVSLTAEDVNEMVNKKEIEFEQKFFNLSFPDKKFNLYYANLNFLNVMDYGAVGDGTTDDSTVFNQLLATGNNIFIPAGSYNVPSLNAQGYSGMIYCAGSIVNNVQFDNFHGHIIGGTWKKVTIANSSNYCTLESMTMEGGTEQGLYVNSCNGLKVLDCRVTGCKNTFQIVESDYCHVENCYVTMNSTETEDYHAMQFYYCDYGSMINCRAENATWFYFSVFNSNYCTLTNCISRNSLHEGINLENANNCVVNGCVCTWDGTTSNDYGICIFGNSGVPANLNMISNCIVNNSAQSGIAIDGSAQSNIAISNILGNVNVKNVIRLYAMTSAQLEGYSGRPANNYFLNNMIVAGKYTAGFFQEINPLGVNQVMGNGCDKFLPAGSYTTAVFANNYPSGTHPTTITAQQSTAEVSEAFIQYVSSNWAFIQCNVTMESKGELTLNIPVNTSSIGICLAYTQTGIVNGLPSNATIHYNSIAQGAANIRAFLHFNNIVVK